MVPSHIGNWNGEGTEAFFLLVLLFNTIFLYTSNGNEMLVKQTHGKSTAFQISTNAILVPTVCVSTSPSFNVDRHREYHTQFSENGIRHEEKIYTGWFT